MERYCFRLIFCPFRQHPGITSYIHPHVRRFTAETTLITSSYSFRVTSSRWIFQVHSRLHCRRLYEKEKTRERKSNQEKMQRNERLIWFDVKWIFREQWSNHVESAMGSCWIMVLGGNRERNRTALPIENTSDGRIICTRVNIDTLISTVIYYSERDVCDNILHAATSYFMQKAVKRKRPRIVFDDSSAGCVLWGVTLAR